MPIEQTNNSSIYSRALARVRPVVAIGEWVTLIFNVAKATLRRPPALKLVMQQLYDVGVASLPVVAITGFFTGLVLAAQSIYQLADKGLTSVTGLMVTKAMMTELGPGAYCLHGDGQGRGCDVRGVGHDGRERADRCAPIDGGQSPPLSYSASLYRGDFYDAAAHDF